MEYHSKIMTTTHSSNRSCKHSSQIEHLCCELRYKIYSKNESLSSYVKAAVHLLQHQRRARARHLQFHKHRVIKWSHPRHSPPAGGVGSNRQIRMTNETVQQGVVPQLEAVTVESGGTALLGVFDSKGLLYQQISVQ